MSEEDNKVIVPGKPPKEKAPKAAKAAGPSMEQFENLQTQVTDALGMITKQLGALQENPGTVKSVAVLEGGPDDQTPMPSTWRKAVVEILGPEFDCEMVQPDTGGTKFKIIVPRAQSNATQSYWEMHKRDIRTKEIGATGLTGVKEWCLKVRANLTASGIKLVQYP